MDLIPSEPTITTTDKQYYVADLVNEQTDRYIIKRLRFAFERDFGNNTDLNVYSSWIPVNKLSPTESWSHTATLPLYQQDRTITLNTSDDVFTQTNANSSNTEEIAATDSAVYALDRGAYPHQVRKFNTALEEQVSDKVTLPQPTNFPGAISLSRKSTCRTRKLCVSTHP